MSDREPNPRVVRVVQLGILVLFGVFVLGLIIWIIGLIRLSVQLGDIPSASIGISLVAIPVFILLLGVSSYVVLGILYAPKDEPETGGPGAGAEEEHHEG